MSNYRTTEAYEIKRNLTKLQRDKYAENGEINKLRDKLLTACKSGHKGSLYGRGKSCVYPRATTRDCPYKAENVVMKEKSYRILESGSFEGLADAVDLVFPEYYPHGSLCIDTDHLGKKKYVQVVVINPKQVDISVISPPGKKTAKRINK